MPDAIDGETAEAIAAGIVPPEQPPMDDAAGGPTADDVADAALDDLPVQGGE